MLRITTIAEHTPIVTLKVEGRIVSDWIPTLEHESLGLLERGKAVDLDFSGVTFVDAQGVTMLRNLLTAREPISTWGTGFPSGPLDPANPACSVSKSLNVSTLLRSLRWRDGASAVSVGPPKFCRSSPRRSKRA